MPLRIRERCVSFKGFAAVYLRRGLRSRIAFDSGYPNGFNEVRGATLYETEDAEGHSSRHAIIRSPWTKRRGLSN